MRHFFSSDCFKILSLLLNNLIMIWCLAWVLTGHWASWLSFHQICKNFYHYFLKHFFCPLFSFSSGFPITHILAAWSCFAHLFEVIFPYVYFVLDSFYFYVIKFTDIFFCNFKLPLMPTMCFSSYTMLFSSLGAGLGYFLYSLCLYLTLSIHGTQLWLLMSLSDDSNICVSSG